MKYRYLAVLIITPTVFVLDQLTKWLIVMRVRPGEEIVVIPGYFDIIHTRNVGAAFGMMATIDASLRVPFFYLVAAVAAAVILVMLWKMRDDERLMPVAFALVLAGIAGNIVDRLRFGAVVDFLSFHWRDAEAVFSVFGRTFTIVLSWPAFNVADSVITIAMFLLVLSAFRVQKTQS